MRHLPHETASCTCRWCLEVQHLFPHAKRDAECFVDGNGFERQRFSRYRCTGEIGSPVSASENGLTFAGVGCHFPALCSLVGQFSDGMACSGGAGGSNYSVFWKRVPIRQAFNKPTAPIVRDVLTIFHKGTGRQNWNGSPASKFQKIFCDQEFENVLRPRARLIPLSTLVDVGGIGSATICSDANWECCE